MTFEIGEKVVYPNQGVGTVENISTRSFGSALEKFYLLRFGYNGVTVLAPFSNLAYLANGFCPVIGDWKARYRENAGRMQSGDLLKAAEVFKNLLQVHVEKPLSFREKKMLDRAQHMLVSEISTARRLPEAHACAVLQRALAKAGLASPAAD